MKYDDPEDPTEDAGEEPVAGSEEAARERYYAAILRYILDDNDERRSEAIQLISQFECDERLEEPLMKLLNSDKEPWIRSGILGIGLWRHSDGATQLINFFTDHANRSLIDADMEESIIISLGQIGGQEAFDFLTNYVTMRYQEHPDDQDMLGMAGLEGITMIAMRGHQDALDFLIAGCRHASWNMREACADSFSVIFSGKKQIPRSLYDLLVEMTKDPDKNVRIAAYMSLDAIVGLDEKNKQILAEARRKQVFGS